MSHAWDADQLGRSTHCRVKALCSELKALGWKVWFDEDNLVLGANIDSKMASGICNSDAVCVFITRSYIEKVNAQNTNCSKEWNLAYATGKTILPIVMEKNMLDPKNWDGIAAMYLGNTLYLDCTRDNVRQNALKLSNMLELTGMKRKKASAPYSNHEKRCVRQPLMAKRYRTTIRL